MSKIDQKMRVHGWSFNELASLTGISAERLAQIARGSQASRPERWAFEGILGGGIFDDLGHALPDCAYHEPTPEVGVRTLRPA